MPRGVQTKDVDQIHEDLKPESIKRMEGEELDGDLPGAGQFYCLHCAKYYIDRRALTEHMKSKVHKRRLRQLKDEPYTQAEAEAAAGMGSYQKAKEVVVPKEPLIRGAAAREPPIDG